jgi:site-specific recombinase XerD
MLRSRNRARTTIKSYLDAIDLFVESSDDAGRPTAVNRVTRADVERFVGEQLEQWKPKTAAIRYGALLQFFKWCVEEGELTTSPMINMKPPHVPEAAIAFVPDADLKKLLKACEGTSFEQRRDMAILRLLIEGGLRLAEITGLKVDDVDWDYEIVLVTGKGSRPRAVPFGSKTSQALDRYGRARKKHPKAKSPAWWLGAKGPLTDSGITQILRRRCKDAGLGPLHPHQLRHTAAHIAAKSGLGDSDMMRIFGWRSRQMLNRYGASAADERARDAYKALAPGDRL